MSDGKKVLFEKHGHVGLIIFNRPDQMNASSRSLRRDLQTAITSTDNDPEIRVVVLTGEGRGFSSGADLTEDLSSEHATVAQHILKDHKPLIDQIAQSEKIYIAAVNGAAAGVKLAYVMSCDIVMMAENAYLFSPFAGIGLVPDGGASWFLVKSFGYHRAFEIIAERSRVSAQECLDAGLISSIVPSGENVREAALSRAKSLAETSAPLSLKFSKRLLRYAQTASREDVTVLESDFQNICTQSKDMQEGIASFLQKRTPKFKGE